MGQFSPTSPDPEEASVWVCVWGALCAARGNQPQQSGFFLAWVILIALFWETWNLGV